MAYSGTTLSLRTGLVSRVFTAFGADIDFNAQAFIGEAFEANGRDCREILAAGAGILQMQGIDTVPVPIDVTALGPVVRITTAYRGVFTFGTTFVGSLLVIW